MPPLSEGCSRVCTLIASRKGNIDVLSEENASFGAADATDDADDLLAGNQPQLECSRTYDPLLWAQHEVSAKCCATPSDGYPRAR